MPNELDGKSGTSSISDSIDSSSKNLTAIDASAVTIASTGPSVIAGEVNGNVHNDTTVLTNCTQTIIHQQVVTNFRYLRHLIDTVKPPNVAKENADEGREGRDLSLSEKLVRETNRIMDQLREVAEFADIVQTGLSTDTQSGDKK